MIYEGELSREKGCYLSGELEGDQIIELRGELSGRFVCELGGELGGDLSVYDFIILLIYLCIDF